MTDQPTVALLGTGVMGAGMARNILAAGIPLRVWNRSLDKAEPLAGAGAEVAGSPADAVRGAEVVITMLYDADSVAEVLAQAREGLAPGTVLLQQSTVGVAGFERLDELAHELGLVHVDAPVLGTRKPAEDGTLVVLAAGPDDARSRVSPVLDAVGARTVWVGPAGQASRLKLVANGWVLTVLEGLAQSLRMARAVGLDPRLFLETVKGGPLDAPYLHLKGAAMLEDAYDVSFALDGALKDTRLIIEAARQAGTRHDIAELAVDYLQRASDDGHGGKDMAATWLAH